MSPGGIQRRITFCPLSVTKKNLARPVSSRYRCSADWSWFVITEFAGNLRYVASASADLNSTGVRPSKNLGFRSRSRGRTPVTLLDSNDFGRAGDSSFFTPPFEEPVGGVGTRLGEYFFTPVPPTC